jgi:phosphohistidine phosphatase SixA
MSKYLGKLTSLLINTSKIFIVLSVLTASLLTLYDNRAGIKSIISSPIETEGQSDTHAFWAKKILDGGYILFFRHAERDKYLDVQVYDSLETSLVPKSLSGYRLGEEEYFSSAVCLNERGIIQARSIGEIVSDINLPVGKVIVSPSCRARQTALIAFGGYERAVAVLVHRGPYKEDFDEHKIDVKDFLAQLSVSPERNTIVVAHNDVIDRIIFTNSFDGASAISLEEGGFVVISQSKSGSLTLEHIFTNFLNFSSQFYDRPKS